MFCQLKKDKTASSKVEKLQSNRKDVNTFSIEGRPNSARVAEFDGAAPFAELFLKSPKLKDKI